MWLAVGVVVGVAPLLFDYASGVPTQRLVTALLLTPLMLAAIARDQLGRAWLALGSALLVHNVLAVLLVMHDPVRMAGLIDGGPAYWDKTLRWLQTGENDEYALRYWVPHHLQLLAAMTFFTYVSLGWVTLWRGFYEIDWMNYYVGNLMTHSQSPWPAVAVGWHPWSICRGVGFVFLTYEVASWSFQRLTGVPLSSPSRRLARWGVGIGLLLVDAAIKFFFMEDVRVILSGNLSTDA
jgi:hypothetical protein